MESRKSIEDFLREVDEDLLIYAGELRRHGFTSTASAKYLTENDLAGIPEGHKRLILTRGIQSMEIDDRKTNRSIDINR
jgi:hypothetical protein